MLYGEIVLSRTYTRLTASPLADSFTQHLKGVLPCCVVWLIILYVFYSLSCKHIVCYSHTLASGFKCPTTYAVHSLECGTCK